MSLRDKQDSTFNRVLGDRLKAARLAAGLTQAEAAVALDCTLGHLSKYEAGIHPVKAADLARLAQRYGTVASELLYGLKVK